MLAQLAMLDHKAQQEIQVYKDQQVMMAQLVQLVMMVQLVQLEIWVYKDPQATMAQLVQLDHKAK
jgi:hypothetical protein